MANRFSIEESLHIKDTVQEQVDDIVAELIKERKRRKITQVELSKKIGVPQATVSRFESFSVVPSIQIIVKIADGLDLSLNLKRKRERLNED